MKKVQIISDKNLRSLKLKSIIQKKINQNKVKRSNIIIVIGGDGFMLQTLKKNRKLKISASFSRTKIYLIKTMPIKITIASTKVPLIKLLLFIIRHLQLKIYRTQL